MNELHLSPEVTLSEAWRRLLAMAKPDETVRVRDESNLIVVWNEETGGLIGQPVPHSPRAGT